ncbi:MAG: FAD-dependent oxidoreductase [Planctomycetota bacterium]
MPTLRHATVERQRLLAPHVHEMTLVVQGEPLRFRPGQWLSLSLPVGEHPPLSRAYSLAEPDHGDGRLQLCFERAPSGLASRYLAELKPGEEIAFAGPHGEFVLPEPLDHDLLFVARFTGIVPIRCMIRAWQAHPSDCNVTLVFGATRPDLLLYHAEFEKLARDTTQFRYLPTLLTEHPGWPGSTGNEMTLVHRLLRENTALVPYVCGLRDMVNEVRAVLTEFGFPRREVKSEVYG